MHVKSNRKLTSSNSFDWRRWLLEPHSELHGYCQASSNVMIFNRAVCFAQEFASVAMFSFIRDREIGNRCLNNISILEINNKQICPIQIAETPNLSKLLLKKCRSSTQASDFEFKVNILKSVMTLVKLSHLDIEDTTYLYPEEVIVILKTHNLDFFSFSPKTYVFSGKTKEYVLGM